MKNHTKVYLTEMGYEVTDFISCEVCGKRAVDIHHIQPRGMGGSKKLDTIDNLMALCRECHHEADFGTKLPKESLKAIHVMRMAGL